MLETEKYLDAVFVECVRLKEFKAHALFEKFVDSNLSGEDTYHEKKNVTNALGFLESKHFFAGETKPEFTPNLRLLTEVRYGSLATLGKVMAHVPRSLRIGLFFVLLRWKACLSILGSLAFFKLAHNAYLGAVLLAGWLEYVSAAILFWIVYLLIRRALT